MFQTESYFVLSLSLKVGRGNYLHAGHMVEGDKNPVPSTDRNKGWVMPFFTRHFTSIFSFTKILHLSGLLLFH